MGSLLCIRQNVRTCIQANRFIIIHQDVVQFMLFHQSWKFEFHFHWKMDFLFMFSVLLLLLRYYLFPSSFLPLHLRSGTVCVCVDCRMPGNVFMFQAKVFEKSFRLLFLLRTQNCKTTNLWQHSSLMVAVMALVLPPTLMVNWALRETEGKWVHEMSIAIGLFRNSNIYCVCSSVQCAQCTSWVGEPVTQLHLLIINIAMFGNCSAHSENFDLVVDKNKYF